MENIRLKQMANAIRILSIDAISKAKSGHPGMVLGIADVASVLFAEFLRFNPKDPKWANRDRFILSAGHGSMLLYSLLYLCGYDEISLEEIKNFRQLHSKCPGHPEYNIEAGIEVTSGPLGQGIANAVGMAIASELSKARLGQKIINHKTYVLAGDGCLMEGISYEAISLAGHLKLKNLILIYDDNQITIDGPTKIATSENQIARFKAANWNTIKINGHDYDQIRNAFKKALNSNKPTLINCKTIIGYGSNYENSANIHGTPLSEKEVIQLRKNLNWKNNNLFEIDENILINWREVSLKYKKIYDQWHEQYESIDKKTEFERRINSELPDNLDRIFIELKQKCSKEPQATRQASAYVLEELTKHLPELIGGSADLTTSNNTKTKNMISINSSNFNGNYLHYGIREHAMAAIMNGIALYKSYIVYGGTFLVFSDYARPSIRLACLMKQRVIYIFTHDSIGLGEDGPTHQPVEHLASLRAIPNLLTFRPADVIETIESWQIALNNKSRPSVLALSRQSLKKIRLCDEPQENKTAKGAYVFSQNQSIHKVTIFASGSELHIAIKAKEILEEKNIGTKLISMVCMELFEEQDANYKNYILDDYSLKVAVEAGVSFGWDRYITKEGIFIGMQGFGESAPEKELYEYFEITAEKIVEKILQGLK